MLREAFRDDAAGLTGGLILWVQNLLPLPKEKAVRLADAEETLRRALDILAAVRKDALGDRTALLALPIELRSLILRRLGRESEAESGQAAVHRQAGATGRTRRRRK
jgi:hypothetical protein